ncbi:restriction endonuclease [Vibrio antiquarius]|uniref:restriction endonuclease n=1 Tax=Vibrio antiquarius (strain Ex25) TaxID=150340 RepID=UPI0026599FFE|nr:restriction endonuclease [Vibrio antiquarius]MCE9843765.1 restriction endonuclease [Vibrio antiquarius]
MSEVNQPTVIETDDVLALLDKIELTNVIEVGIKSMPFLSLTPEQFELLLWDLFHSGSNEPELKFNKARLMITGADQGRDVWLTHDGKPTGLVQCKREEKKYSRKDVLKEVIKFLLHSELNHKLLPQPEAFTYCLALSKDPKGEVDDFFENPIDWLKDNRSEIESTVKLVIRSYQTFLSIKSEDVLDSLLSKVELIRYQLIRPHELNRWLDIHQDVRQRFFKLPQDSLPSPYKFNAVNLKVSDLKEASLPLHNWQKTIENRFIARPELERLEHQVKSEESKCYLLTGVAGSGKSSLLSSLYERLLSTERKVLAIKADELDKNINDIDDLASFIKCEGQGGLVASLLDLSKDSPLVLIVDQMDAVSEVMDQSSNRFRVLIDLILSLKSHFEARKTFPIHIITSSRPFEASFDTRFKQLDADEIELSPLKKGDVEHFLNEINIDKTTIPASMYPTLQVPFALGLYVSLVKSGANKTEISPKNLLARWWEKKLPDPALRGQCDKFLRRLASDMVRDEVLRRPVSAYIHDYQYLISKLESVGILVRYENNIGFSHQAWLDDFQSQSFVNGDNNFFEFVLEKQNGLFSRSTILRGLEYLREHNKSDYHRTIDKLLFDQSVRRHVYHLLIDVMTSTPTPDYEDSERIFEIIETDSPLASRVISKTAQKWGLWREYLLDELPSLMQTSVHSEDVVLWLIEEFKFDEDYAVSLMIRHWQNDIYYTHSFDVLSRSKASSVEAVKLAKKLISCGKIDKYSISHYIETLFNDLKLDAAFKLLAKWLQTEQDEILWERSLSVDSYIITHPLRFIEVLFPWFIEVLQKEDVQKEVSRTFRRSVSFGGNFDEIANSEGMIGLLLKALVQLANDDPRQYISTIKKYSHIDFDEVQSLLAIAFASNPTALASDIVNYLVENYARLCIGHGCFQDEHNVMHFVDGHLTMMLLEEASPYWTIPQSEIVRDAIKAYKLHPPRADIDVEIRRHFLVLNEKYRLSLLDRLPRKILSPRMQRQISERDTSHELKVGQRCKGIGMASIVTSPMSSERMKLATAEDIMNLLNQLSDPSVDIPDRWRRWGGAELSQFSHAFSQFAVAEPQKAISILHNHFVKGIHEKVAGDVVAELASTKTLPVDEIKQLINDMNNKGFSCKEWIRGVSRAYEEVARNNKGLSQSEIALLVDYLKTYPDNVTNTIDDDDYEHDNYGAVLFGNRSSIHVRSGCSSNILAAIYMGLLARDKPDYEQLINILLHFLQVSKSKSAWEYILVVQGKALYWASREKVNSLFYKVFDTIPALFSTPALIHTLWDLTERLDEHLLTKILTQWISSDNDVCKQAAAELIAGLVISNRASESMTPFWETMLQSGDIALRKGGIFAAASGLYLPDGEIRANSHAMLMSCVQGVDTRIASAFNSIFLFNNRLPQDDLTLQLLLYLSAHPELVRKLDSHRLLEALVTFNPRPRALRPILLIVRTIIEKKLEGARRTYIQDVEKLVELTVTLQRSSHTIKEQAMSLYEMLLDAGSYQAEKAAEVASRT